MTKIKSVGQCVFCSKEYSKSGMTRHLSTHLTSKIITDKPGTSFHLKIETSAKWGAMPYFLHLWVNGTCTFDKIDAFLRGIWLECCGHMSAFRMAKNASNDAGMFDTIDAFEHLNAGDTHKYNDLMTAANGQIPIEDKLMEHAQKGLKIEYEYDFGSSTELDITVVNEYPIVAPQKLFLMTRNEPINFPCVSCGKNNAIEICTSCSCDGAAEYCAKCAKIHTKECVDFDEYSMPLVNSPRAGVCGYTGGEIDKKRDK